MQTPYRTKIIGIILGSMLLGGCATNSRVDSVSAEAQDAKRKAEQAIMVANEAAQTAQEANARSQRTEEMMNKSFKKSMRK